MTVSTDVDTVAADDREQLDLEQILFREDGLLSKDHALVVTATIKGYASQLYRHVLRAHERRIWLSLGYATWAEYCDVELGVSRSRGYQIVDWGLVDRALTAGSPVDTPPPVDDLDHLTEAQARPLARFKHDQRASRLIWARARELAGPNADPTQADVQAAVDEWQTTPMSDVWRTETRLVTGPWSDDDTVWWMWQTPAEGVVLVLGVGPYSDEPLFRSEPRYGDLFGVAAEDLDTLVPRLIAELFARQVPAEVEVHEVARLVADVDVDPIKRGPFRLTHRQVSEVFLELAHIYDDDCSWSDTSSHETVEQEPVAPAVTDEVAAAWTAFDEAVLAYKTEPDTKRREMAELRRSQLANALLGGDTYAHRGLLVALRDVAGRYRTELDANGPVDTKKRGVADLHRFDGFRDELLEVLDRFGASVPEPWRSRVVERDTISFNRAAEYPQNSVFPRLRIDDLIEALADYELADPDDEVVDAEIVDDDDAVPAPGTSTRERIRVLAQLRDVEAELAGDCSAVRRLTLVQKRLDLEAELEGRSPSPSAAPASRRPAAAPSPDSPSGDTPAGDDGSSPVPSSPVPAVAPSRSAAADVTDKDLFAGVVTAVEVILAADEDGDQVDVADLQETARWLRAAASRLETRVSAITREGTAA